MNLKKMLAMTGTAALICAAAMAQDNAPGGGRTRGGGDGGPGGGRGNFDPAQFQQRMMERLREQMDVKDEGEWKIIQERVQKVWDARRDLGPAGFGRGMGRRGGEGAPEGGQRRGGFGQPSPELEALQNAIENNAPTDQIKSALEKYRKARKEKEAALEKAQAELKKVLSVKQEAVAVANGLLN
jgi:hypothetical protein